MKQHEIMSRQAFESRLETVKPLKETEFEQYAIVKDRESGQHYLRYSFFHISLAEGGRRDDYDYYLPLASDDVLGIVVGEQPYEYPEHWTSVYWRSGRDDRLMPFDPADMADLKEDAAEEQALLEALARYKREWLAANDKEALTQQFFAELDKRFKKQ